ncbi:MAG: DUF4367 domain-containing protein [Sedimentibacter sp.]
MSESNKNNHRKYSIYDNMSTEVLEEILRADSQLQNDEDSDIDTILYIMEVIAKREKEQPTGKFTDVQTAWTSFSENYLPYIENDKSLYDDEDIKDKTDIKQIPLYKSSTSRKRRLQLRATFIVAIVAVMLFVGTVTANALGFDLWKAVAKWTKDTFSFSNVIINKEKPDDLQETLDKYGLNTKVAPTWFPDGYSFESVDVAENPLRTTIRSIYSSNNGEISVTIVLLANPSTSIYEKDSKDIITYSVDDIEHYIMTNLERTKVVWMTDNYECSITGKFSIEEAKKIIDSIYER